MELDRRDTELLNNHIEKLEKEIKLLVRNNDLKDQIITTYRIENAKMFHQIEKLEEEIEEYESLLKIKE